MSAERLAVRLLHSVCQAMWGFRPAVIEAMVATRGGFGALRWFAANMPRYLVTMRVLGPVRVHLACVVVALRSRCLYCAHSHVYALELLHLRDRGRLFPIDARHLDEWIGLDDRTLRRRLHAVLVTAGLPVEALWADRILAIANGQEPVDAAEARLAHVVRVVETMTVIATATAPDLAQAHDPVNKNTAIKNAHTWLRAAATT